MKLKVQFSGQIDINTKINYEIQMLRFLSLKHFSHLKIKQEDWVCVWSNELGRSFSNPSFSNIKSSFYQKFQEKYQVLQNAPQRSQTDLLPLSMNLNFVAKNLTFLKNNLHSTRYTPTPTQSCLSFFKGWQI